MHVHLLCHQLGCSTSYSIYNTVSAVSFQARSLIAILDLQTGLDVLEVAQVLLGDVEDGPDQAGDSGHGPAQDTVVDTERQAGAISVHALINLHEREADDSYLACRSAPASAVGRAVRRVVKNSPMPGDQGHHANDSTQSPPWFPQPDAPAWSAGRLH
eukprot:356602-Chlamydomonas_euryale.AAC.5